MGVRRRGGDGSPTPRWWWESDAEVVMGVRRRGGDGRCRRAPG